VNSESELTQMTYLAAKMAFLDLFKVHPGTYYYCSLVTYGLADGPALSAWSYEALAECVARSENPGQAIVWLKWSYADSPYFCFRDDLFEPIRQAFEARGGLGSDNWQEEYNTRMRIMESAMRLADQDGVFGTSEARSKLVVAVEVMPPDWTNTERVKRLNPPEAVAIWLSEYDNS
jgi:hypothetical protein